MGAGRLISFSLAPGLILFLFLIKDAESAVRCASTRQAGVGFVYDEDVQLSALAANSLDALPGRRVPGTYQPRKPYQPEERRPYSDRDAEYAGGRNGQYNDYRDDDRRIRPSRYGSAEDWPVGRNGTGGSYPADGPRDRISNQDRYPSRRNDSFYGDTDDAWKPIPDEPSGRRQYGRSGQRRYENDEGSSPDFEYGLPRLSPYPVGDEDDGAEDSRLLAILIKREKERQQKNNSTVARQPDKSPRREEKYDRRDDDDREDKRRDRPNVSERYRERDDEDYSETCPIETRQTTSHQTDFPLTAVSAILSVPIGDFILYAAEAPGKAIITYNLICEGPEARGKEPLYTATANSCFHIQTVEDLVNVEQPTPIVICLSHGAFSTAFRVDYDQNQFRLQPCLQIIEHKFLTDVATISAGKAGTLVAFSSNDLRPEAEYHETIAPIYIARGGELLLCGYVDVQHTTDVALWHVRGKEYVVAYIEKRPGSRRSLLHFFEIVIKNGRCHSISPKRKQPIIGGQHYKGQRNTLCASEPFTIDNAMCGAEDIQFLTSHDKVNHPSTHLAVAIANDAFEEGRIGCPDHELVCPDNTRDKCFCACPHANHRSFLLEFDRNKGQFDFTGFQRGAFQELTGGPESVTEITHLPTEKCCMVFQTISPLGATELYTIENDGNGTMRVFQFFDSGLPHFVEKSSFGYCTANDLIISYTLHSFQTDNTIYHLQCNKDRRTEWVDRSYSGGNDNRQDRRDNDYGDRDRGYRTGANRYRGSDENSKSSYLNDERSNQYGNSSRYRGDDTIDTNRYRNQNGRDYNDRNSQYGQYGNSSSNYPLPPPRRENYGNNPYNRTVYRDTAADNYKYRPYNLPPSQSSARTYGQARISAVLPDMDFGNQSFDLSRTNYPINPQVSQQYNRPAAYNQTNRQYAPQAPPPANYPPLPQPYQQNNRTAYYNQPPPPPPPVTYSYQPAPSYGPPPPPQYQDTYPPPPQQSNYAAPPLGGWPVSYNSRYNGMSAPGDSLDGQ